MRSFAVPLLGFVVAGCSTSARNLVGTQPGAASSSSALPGMAATDASAPAPSSSAALGAALASPTCPEADLGLPAYDTALIPEALPTIVDASHNLLPFTNRLAAVSRKTATDHVRIAVFGDSNMTMDYISGGLRRILQTKYGDAGHGFVAMARPWKWYRHRDVRHELWESQWRPFATSTHQVGDGHYGLANIASESKGAGSWAYVETAANDAPIGKAVSSIDLFYLTRPGTGTFTVRIDGKDAGNISTQSAKVETAFHHYDVSDGPHRFGVLAKSAGIRMYGASFERAGASVVVDSFGTGALNYEQLLHVSDESRLPMLARRNYDLVIILLGTNMFAPDHHEGWVSGSVERLRRANPALPILLLSPPDLEKNRAATHSDPRVVKLGEQLQVFAKTLNVGFWDFRAAMGGDMSMMRFSRAGFADWDLIHFRAAGGALMGERLAHALTAFARAAVTEDPVAGCTDRPKK